MEKSIDKPKDAKTSHYLGVDFGTAKVGLAKADSETKIAFSYGTLPNDKDFIEKLREIIKKEEIGTVVIGVPEFRNRGDMGNQGIYRGLEEKIRKEIPELKIFFHDEMFTTKMAQDNLKEAGKNKVGQIDDAEAARIILQSWLDKSNY